MTSPRPAFVGLAGVLLFLPFGIAGQQIALGVGLLGLLAEPDARRRTARLLAAPGTRPVLLGAAAWIAASALALLLSGRADGARELRKLLLLPALLLPAGAIGSRRDLRFASAVLLLSLLAASLLGIVEQARGGGDHPTRLDGPIGFYMTTAGVLLVLSLPALALLAEAKSRLARVAFPAAAAALLLTYTRGAWLAFAAGASLLLLRRKRKLALPALLLFALLLAAVPSFRERIAGTGAADFAPDRERELLWDAGRRAFLDRPWRGAGLHDLGPLLRAYRSPEAEARLTHFHSLYLQTAVAMGIPGLAALALLFGGLALALLRAARAAPPGAPRALAEGALAALAAFLVHGLFEWNLGDSEVALALWTAAGLGLAAGRFDPAEIARAESDRG